MIIYDLQCENGHRFEGWFRDRDAFNEQNSRQLVNCPVCNCVRVDIIPSSITIMSKDSRAEDKAEAKIVSHQKAMEMLYQYIDKNFEDVGDKFAEVAIRIHYGEEEKRNIRGTTTAQEEESLTQEGIKFIKVPIPKMDS